MRITAAALALLLPLLGAAAAQPQAGHPGSRTVRYGERDIIPVRAKLRHATLIVLPQGEQILDFVCGDADFWVINGAENFAHVKPAKEGLRTNLNLIAASGRVYSFSLEEVSGEKGAQPDLKVFVQPKEGSQIAVPAAQGRFVAAERLRTCTAHISQVEAEAAQREREAGKAAQRAVEDFQASYPLSLDFGYDFRRNKKPFRVQAIYSDGRFTYIRARPSEAPALYEVKDGKPSLIGFDYRDGVYVAPKVLDEGYLAVGKRRLRFKREGK